MEEKKKENKFFKWLSERVLWKILFYIVGRIYTLSLMFVFDFIINIYYLIKVGFKNQTKQNLNKIKELKKQYKDEFEFKEYQRNAELFLDKNYKYRYDGDDLFGGKMKGFPDWNIRFLRVAAGRGFDDDCDGYATLADYLFNGTGKKYSIVPFDLNYRNRMHVVYVDNGNVYSSGQILSMSFKTYIKKAYTDKGVKVFTMRHF